LARRPSPDSCSQLRRYHEAHHGARWQVVEHHLRRRQHRCRSRGGVLGNFLEQGRPRSHGWVGSPVDEHGYRLIPSSNGLTVIQAHNYVSEARPTRRAVHRSGNGEVVEGAWPGSVVLMEFASLTAAQNWYNSPEYQKLLQLRVNNAISDLILVESP